MAAEIEKIDKETIKRKMQAFQDSCFSYCKAIMSCTAVMVVVNLIGQYIGAFHLSLWQMTFFLWFPPAFVLGALSFIFLLSYSIMLLCFGLAWLIELKDGFLAGLGFASKKNDV